MKLGKHEISLKPIAVQGIALDKTEDGKKEIYISKIGNPLKKVQLQKSEYKWVDEVTGKEHEGKAFKSFKGKAISSFPKTKTVETFQTINSEEMRHLVENEKTYLVSGDSLKHELMEKTGKAYFFKYANAGLKRYNAVLYYDDILERVIMRCFRGDLRKITLDESKDEIKANDIGVPSLDINADLGD